LYFPPYSFLGFDLRAADEAQSWEDREQLGASVAAVTLPACRGDTPQGVPAPARLPPCCWVSEGVHTSEAVSEQSRGRSPLPRGLCCAWTTKMGLWPGFQSWLPIFVVK